MSPTAATRPPPDGAETADPIPDAGSSGVLRGRGGRPRKATSRLRQVRFRLTDAEWAAAETKAQKAGLSVPLYLRAAGLGGKVRVATAPTVSVAAVAELNRVGVNLNQIARRLNATGDAPPPELAEACRAVTEAVMAAVGGLDDGDEPGRGAEG